MGRISGTDVVAGFPSFGWSDGPNVVQDVCQEIRYRYKHRKAGDVTAFTGRVVLILRGVIYFKTRYRSVMQIVLKFKELKQIHMILVL